MSAAAFGASDMLESLKDQSSDSEISISAISVVEGFNPRRLLGDQDFTNEALEGLSASIQKFGILQPLLVRRRKTEILLIAGERRLSAAKLAGLEKVPVIFIEADDQLAYELAIIENSQRNDLDIVTETLVGFRYLSDRLKLTPDELITYLHNVRKGRRQDDLQVETILREMYGTGISVWGQQRAQILKMTSVERTAIQQRKIDAKVCSELVHLPEGDSRTRFLQKAIDEQLTAAQLRTLIKSEQAQITGIPPLTLRANTLKKLLPKAHRLKGVDAQRAEQLMQELESILTR